MSLKEMGRVKRNSKLQLPKRKIKCPYCSFHFVVSEDDYDCEGNVIMYWCKDCGEQFVENLKIK